MMYLTHFVLVIYIFFFLFHPFLTNISACYVLPSARQDIKINFILCNRHPKDCAFYCNCNPHHSFSEDRHPVPIKKPKNQDDDDDEDLNDANFDEVSEKTTEKSLMMLKKHNLAKYTLYS